MGIVKSYLFDNHRWNNNYIKNISNKTLVDRVDLRFHPRTKTTLHWPKKIKNLINKKHIGEIVSVNLSFYCPHMKKSDWRYKKKLGGGALLDIGCYPVSTYLNLFKNNSV